MIFCKFCNKECLSRNSYLNHERMCKMNPDRKLPITDKEKIDKIAAVYRARAICKYNDMPKLCIVCNGSIPYKGRANKTCSDECRARLQSNNSKARYTDIDYVARKNQSLIDTLSKKEKKFNYKLDLKTQYKINKSHCKLKINTCGHCNVRFSSRQKKKYCQHHEYLYSANGRNQYLFTFNVYHYPELLDLTLIQTYNWRCTKTNPNGVTRDHRVSVNEAIRNGYDPYYIKHPLNCELMLFSDNNKKKHYSSMSYEELVKAVDSMENRNCK